MTENQIRIYLSELEQQLFNSPKELIELTRNWTKKFENKPAVYVFWEEGKICYVGESSCFKGRMGDILNTKNHTLRRNLGNHYFSDHPLYTKPSSKKSFCSEIELLLISKIKALKLSYLYVDLGRKELEEQIYEKHQPPYNLKGKRKIR